MVFSDSKINKGTLYLEDIYISDEEKQKLHFKISENIPDIFYSKNNSVLNKVFALSLTRFSLQRNQFLIPYLLAEKLKQISEGGDLILLISKKNKLLGQYLFFHLKDYCKVRIKYHSESDFWKMGLSKKPFYKRIIQLILTSIALFYTLTLILVFYLIKAKKNDVEWMSFANNRKEIDYVILDKIRLKNTSISFPGLIPFQNRYSQLLFRSRKFSIKHYIQFSLNLLKFIITEKIRINGFDEKYPIKFNLSINSIYVLIYQYLLSFETNQINNIRIFRGGNANGIWSSVLNQNSKTILLSHGTEIHPIDHAIHKYVNYYILPSEEIAEKWKKEDDSIKQETLINLGRPFYEVLRLKVNTKVRTGNESKIIGIVLTYSSDERTEALIRETINTFKKYNNVSFLIKERTNFKNDLNYIDQIEKIKIHSGNIFSFLEKVDLVVAGISDFSVLGMTVLDAISLGIPAIYYTQGRDKNELGYSYCEEMEEFTFNNINELKNQLKSYSNFDEVLLQISQKNARTKKLLGPNKGVIDKFVSFVLKVKLNNDQG